MYQQKQTITQKIKIMEIRTALHLNHLINKSIERVGYHKGISTQLVNVNGKEYFINMTCKDAGSMNRYDVKIEINDSIVLYYSYLHIGKSWSANIDLIESIEKAISDKQN